MHEQSVPTSPVLELVGDAMKKARRAIQIDDRSPDEDEGSVETLLLIGKALARDGELSQYLKARGLVVVEAPNASDALLVFQAERPSVVMIDHHIEDDDGVRVLQEVQQQAAKLTTTCRTILVTSTGNMDVAIDSMRAGAFDYLKRPLDMGQLRQSLSRARESATYRRPQEPPTILLLEDHLPTQKRLQRTLEREGYRVHPAGDGDEGLQLFADHCVDVILTDLQMPHRGGLAVLQETMGRGADVEAILVTAHGDEDAVVQALRLGAVDFLRKPLDLDQLLQTLQAICARGIRVVEKKSD